MDILLSLLKAFAVGGLLCALGEILILSTKLTSARILVAYVTAGVILGALGIYEPIAEFAGAGATVPLARFRLHPKQRRNLRRARTRLNGRPKRRRSRHSSGHIRRDSLRVFSRALCKA